MVQSVPPLPSSRTQLKKDIPRVREGSFGAERQSGNQPSSSDNVVVGPLTAIGVEGHGVLMASPLRKEGMPGRSPEGDLLTVLVMPGPILRGVPAREGGAFLV